MKIVPGTTQMIPGPTPGTMVINPAWVAARIGCPTASCFDQIITPKKSEPSASQPKYMATMLAEWFLNRSLEDEKSLQAMERGKELEPQAVAEYEFETGQTCKAVGFVTRDDGKAGASPDRLVGSAGLLEIKAPLIETHMLYLMDPHKLVGEYWCQLQGELYICEREWVDVWSHHPLLPKATVRVERDEDFIAKLEQCLYKFLVELEAGKAKLALLREARLTAMADAMAADENLPVSEGGIAF